MICTKKCLKCKEERSLEVFGKDKSRKDNLNVTCKPCRYKYRQENKKKIAKQNQKHYQMNKEDLNKQRRGYQREYRLKNKEQVALKARRYQQNNRQAYRESCAKYRAKKLKAYIYNENLQEFYKNCPEGFHVDHIIPLQGRDVTGLHTLLNLQYLPHEINRMKKNKVVPELCTIYPSCYLPVYTGEYFIENGVSL